MWGWSSKYLTTVKSGEIAGKIDESPVKINADLVWSNIIRMKTMIGNETRLIIKIRQINFNRIVMFSFLKK